jgi:GTP pyrophosphokinase
VVQRAGVQHETVARGREAVEKLLQREGKHGRSTWTTWRRSWVSSAAEALFEVVGKDEFSLRNIEMCCARRARAGAGRFPAVAATPSLQDAQRRRAGGGHGLADDAAGQVLPPAPPDAILGFVTRGKGVSVHRSRLQQPARDGGAQRERVIEVEWGGPKGRRICRLSTPWTWPVEAVDRQGLLRDISEVFAKEKMNVIGVLTQSVKGTAWMTFTVEISDSGRLARVLGVVAEVSGVRSARRRGTDAIIAVSNEFSGA